MKVVINTCFGGYGLSHAAIKRLAELQGRPCFFFKSSADYKSYVPIEEGERTFCSFAFDIPNPGKDDYKKHAIDDYRGARHNTHLVRVVEELGTKANDACASLKIVEIPDGTDYTIEEYDGNEHIAEVHQTWS